MEYIYGNPNNESWNQVASIFAAHDSVHSAQTSSLPLVQFWQPAETGLEPRVEALIKDCGLEPSVLNNAKFCFEYPVSVQCGGRGKASMTDLMIITDNYAIALEAKWTECGKAYPSISKWLETDKADTNRKKVLEGCIKYINEYLKDKGGHEISLKDEGHRIIPYQLLHRVASACAVAKEKGMTATVIYQLFYNDEREKDDWKSIPYDKVDKFGADLQKGFVALFKDLKKPVPIQFCIMKTKVAKGKYFDTAMRKCKKDGDLNELFLEMQHLNIYSFPPDAK